LTRDAGGRPDSGGIHTDGATTAADRQCVTREEIRRRPAGQWRYTHRRSDDGGRPAVRHEGGNRDRIVN
jgi:hypothetical protein